MEEKALLVEIEKDKEKVIEQKLEEQRKRYHDEIVVHEKKISHLESKVEKNSNDIARLEANANSALKTSRLIGVVLISMATLIVSVFGLFIR